MKQICLYLLLITNFYCMEIEEDINSKKFNKKNMQFYIKPGAWFNNKEKKGVQLRGNFFIVNQSKEKIENKIEEIIKDKEINSQAYFFDEIRGGKEEIKILHYLLFNNNSTIYSYISPMYDKEKEKFVNTLFLCFNKNNTKNEGLILFLLENVLTSCEDLFNDLSIERISVREELEDKSNINIFPYKDEEIRYNNNEECLEKNKKSYYLIELMNFLNIENKNKFIIKENRSKDLYSKEKFLGFYTSFFIINEDDTKSMMDELKSVFWFFAKNKDYYVPAINTFGFDENFEELILSLLSPNLNNVNLENIGGTVISEFSTILKDMSVDYKGKKEAIQKEKEEAIQKEKNLNIKK